MLRNICHINEVGWKCNQPFHNKDILHVVTAWLNEVKTNQNLVWKKSKKIYNANIVVYISNVENQCQIVTF